MQVNQALPRLLDLLLEQCWDAPSTLEVLLSYLPQPDLRSVLGEASGMGCVIVLTPKTRVNRKPSQSVVYRLLWLSSRCSNLYEQDEANVFAEPSVMSAYVLPHLQQMADKCSESSALAQRLRTVMEESAAQVLESLEICRELQPGTASA